MKSVKYSLKQRISKPLFIRRVVGQSMDPYLKDSKIIIGSSLLKPKISKVVIFKHNDLVKIKYLKNITKDGLYLIGLNPEFSTDSRTFGLIDIRSVTGVLIWPLIHSFSTTFPKPRKK